MARQQHLVSRAEFARLRGVSKMAVTKWCDGWLKPACVGKRIDAAHDIAVNGPPNGWPEGSRRLATDRPPTAAPEKPPKAPAPSTGERRKAQPALAQRVSAPTEPRPKTKKRPSQARVREAFKFSLREDDEWEEPDPPEDEGTDADLDRLAQRIRPVVDRFGSMTGLKDWLAALKTIEEIRAKRLDNDEAEGSLIRRDFVRTHVFGAIEAANIRLVNDAPQTIARRIYAKAKAGEPVEEAEIVVHEIISSHLKPVKATAARNLRGE